MERTKGKLTLSDMMVDGVEYVIESEKGMPVFNTLGENDKTNAEHLVRCWNAFESGGLVEKLVGVVADMLSGLEYLRRHDCVPYGFGIDRLEDTGRAALPAEAQERKPK